MPIRWYFISFDDNQYYHCLYSGLRHHELWFRCRGQRRNVPVRGELLRYPSGLQQRQYWCRSLWLHRVSVRWYFLSGLLVC